jgi:hypothetical protein
METLLRDLRQAFRSLLRNPGFSAIAIPSLGLGIRSATTVFTLGSVAPLVLGLKPRGRIVRNDGLPAVVALDDIVQP